MTRVASCFSRKRHFRPKGGSYGASCVTISSSHSNPGGNCMKRRTAGLLSVFTIAFLVGVDVLATCGGGGGGGTGGMGSMGGMTETVFPVPWKVVNGADALPQGGLAVYWFPASQVELEKSSLRNSRTLSLYSQQCVLMGVADVKTDVGQKFAADAKLPIAVLADADGKVINKAVGGDDGKLKVAPVEK